MEMRINKVKHSVILVVVILVGMAGCKTTAKYSQPDLNAPEDFYGTENTASDSLNIVNTGWREFFSDSILISLIDSALIHNIDLQIADAYVEIGIAKLRQSKTRNYPSVGIVPFSHRRDLYSENYNNYGSNRARRNYDGGSIPTSFYKERVEYESYIDVSWELDLWNKLGSRKKADQLAFRKTEEFRKAVKTALITDIASAYFNLALLKSQIEVYKDNLELNDNTLQIVQLQFEAGEVTSLAVKQTLSQKLRAQTLIPQLEREYIKQENRLNRLLGRNSQPIQIKNLELVMFDEEFVAGKPLELINNRPDVASAEFKLQESYERIGIADKMRYPSLTLGASVGLNSFELDKLLNPAGSGLLLMKGLIYQPLFQKRKLKTNYEIALKEKEIAELEFKDKFRRAMNEVSDALVAIEKLKEEFIIAQERVVAAKKALKDASFLFRSGLANYLEVITAQRESLDSELNLENVKSRIFSAEVELYRSLGGGWR